MFPPNWRKSPLTERKITQLINDPPELADEHETTETLRSRIEQLEREGLETREQAHNRVMQAELKVEALRAGMIDLDGLRFLDHADIKLRDEGGIAAGADLMSRLKGAKPWLFAVPASSSVARVPPSRPVRQKLATEMTDDEYRVARANVVRRSVL